MQQNKLLKYLVYSALIIGLFYFISTNSTTLDTSKAMSMALILILALVMLDVFVFRSAEGMTSELLPAPICGGPINNPRQYLYGTMEEDYIKSGLEYDHNLPGYYLINNGKYSEGTIPYDQAGDLINASVGHDLYNQHNFNIIWSPHTHVGKARGYLNWDKIVD